jgi:hypothetical protein
VDHFTFQPLYPRGNSARYPLPHSRSGYCGEEKNFSPLPEIEPRFLGSPASSPVALPAELSRNYNEVNKTAKNLWSRFTHVHQFHVLWSYHLLDESRLGHFSTRSVTIFVGYWSCEHNAITVDIPRERARTRQGRVIGPLEDNTSLSSSAPPHSTPITTVTFHHNEVHAKVKWFAICESRPQFMKPRWIKMCKYYST